MIKPSSDAINGRIDFVKRNESKGFSLVEILVVLAVLAILTAISVPYFYNYKKLFKPEHQAIQIMDLMQEAAQISINRRREIRFEIDLTRNRAIMIDTNGPGAADDSMMKWIPLAPVDEVRMDVNPTGVTAPNPPNYPNVAYVPDSVGHLEGTTWVIGNSTWQMAFRSSGTVVNTAGLPVSATFYSWPPETPGASVPQVMKQVRAVTIFGGSGAVRFWKYNGTAFEPYQ